MSAQSSVSLSETQLAIMHALWRHGEADTQQVCDAVGQERKPLAYTTVATLLKRLERRGLVTHRKEGRKQVFRARITEEQVRTSMVSQLVGSLFDGDSAALVSHLLQEREVSPGDLETIQDMIDREKDK